MQNFNGKVRQYLKENERKKRSRLFGVVLSVVMTVSVLASLVMPAISATEGTSVAGGDFPITAEVILIRMRIASR